ncbi:MAG: glutamyl-tRNA reductase [bacterium]
MQIILVGLGHESAPVELRERLSFQAEKLERALIRLGASTEIAESVIISTCNRVEFYGVARDVEEGLTYMKHFLANFHDVPCAEFEAHLFTAAGVEVVEHLFAVASSIKSMVLGETQIQGQIKHAFEVAQANGCTGPFLSTLFQNTLSVGKRVRRETAISEHSLSISHAAVALLKQQFPEVAKQRVLVVGNGKMGLLAIKGLLKLGVTDLTVINRTEENVRELARKLQVRALGFDHLQACLGRADVVISSTGAPHVIINKEMVENATAARTNRPLLMIDIAVPRDIEQEVGQVDNVTLYNIDQLQETIASNRERRTKELAKVHHILEDEVRKFVAWLQTLEVKPVITRLRQRAEVIGEQELQRAVRRFQAELSENDSRVLRELTTRIINKMLHEPISRLRAEAADGNGQNYTSALNHLFGLEEQQAVTDGDCN